MNKILALFFFLAACSSNPPREMTDVQEGQWRAKALVKDLEQSKSYIVNLNFNSKRDEATRMDVTTTLGTGVASLVVDQKEVRYVLFDQKKFYVGASQPGAMKPILALPFDPRWLQNILFGTALSAEGWSCKKSDKDILLSCEESASGLKVTWTSAGQDKRTVLIEHPKAVVQINFQSFKPKVEERAKLFTLEAPVGYSKLRVR